MSINNLFSNDNKHSIEFIIDSDIERYSYNNYINNNWKSIEYIGFKVLNYLSDDKCFRLKKRIPQLLGDVVIFKNDKTTVTVEIKGGGTIKNNIHQIYFDMYYIKKNHKEPYIQEDSDCTHLGFLYTMKSNHLLVRYKNTDYYLYLFDIQGNSDIYKGLINDLRLYTYKDSIGMPILDGRINKKISEINKQLKLNDMPYHYELNDRDSCKDTVTMVLHVDDIGKINPKYEGLIHQVKVNFKEVE